MKVLSAETNLGSATNVGKSPLVRIYNSDSSTLTVTRKNSGGVTIGSYKLPADKVIYCQKNYTDTLEGSANLKATAIGYSEMLDIVSFSGGGGWTGVTDSLFGRYDFNDSECYSGSGSIITDLSGNSRNGSINTDHSYPQYDSSTFTSTSGGNVFEFAGNQSEISFGTNFPPSSAADVSIFFWIRFKTLSGFNVFAYKQASSGWDMAFMAKANGSDYRFTVENDDYNMHDTNLAINTWYHMGMTLDGPNGDMKLYVSDSSFESAPVTHGGEGRGTFDSSKPFYLGEERVFAGTPCYIAQMQVYNKVLTAAEVEQNYDADKSTFGY